MYVEQQKYLNQFDLIQSSRYFHIPLVVPSIPEEVRRNTLPMMRILAAVQLHYPDKLQSATQIMWSYAWQQDKNLLDAQGQPLFSRTQE